MSSKVTYKELKRNLTIEIKPNYKFLIRFGFVFFYIMPFVFVFGLMLYGMIRDHDFSLPYELNSLYIILISIVTTLIGRNIVKKLYQKEIILIEKGRLTIFKYLFRFSKKRIFPLNQVSDFKLAGKDKFTNHPLKPDGIDYIGIGTEKDLEFIIESGKLSFFYSGSVIQFGKGLLDEDGEEIIRRINNWLQHLSI